MSYMYAYDIASKTISKSLNNFSVNRGEGCVFHAEGSSGPEAGRGSMHVHRLRGLRGLRGFFFGTCRHASLLCSLKGGTLKEAFTAEYTRQNVGERNRRRRCAASLTLLQSLFPFLRSPQNGIGPHWKWTKIR